MYSEVAAFSSSAVSLATGNRFWTRFPQMQPWQEETYLDETDERWLGTFGKLLWKCFSTSVTCQQCYSRYLTDGVWDFFRLSEVHQGCSCYTGCELMLTHHDCPIYCLSVCVLQTDSQQMMQHSAWLLLCCIKTLSKTFVACPVCALSHCIQGWKTLRDLPAGKKITGCSSFHLQITWTIAKNWGIDLKHNLMSAFLSTWFILILINAARCPFICEHHQNVKFP